MSYYAYRLIHLFGILLLFAGLGAMASRGAGDRPRDPAGPLLAGTIIAGMILIPVAGFGLLAVQGMTGALPGWVWAKLAIWLLLGAFAVGMNRRASLSRPAWVLAPLLGVAAAYLAMYRPF